MIKDYLIKSLLVLFVVGYVGNSQVGIGTLSPHNSAQLHVVASNKGVLIPNVQLTGTVDQRTIVEGNVESLLVYNTATISDVVPGYYYWFNGAWRRLALSNEISDVIPDNVVIWNETTNEFHYIDSDGNQQIINLENLVKASETVTTMTPNATKSEYVYKNESGTEVGINIVESVTNNAGDIFNNTDVVNEITKIVDTTETLTKLAYDSTGHILTYTDENKADTKLNMVDLVGDAETVTTMTPNATKSEYVYKNEADAEVSINIVESVTNNAGDIFNNTDVVNEITKIVDTTETLTKLAYNSTDRMLTYTDENKAETKLDMGDLVDHAETLTKLAYDPTDHMLTYTDEDKAETKLDMVDLVGNAVKANNGLGINGGNVQLGGALVAPTTITASASNTLAVAGLQDGDLDDNLVVADATTGELKKVSTSTLNSSYSTSEQLTGKKWIDGSAIYWKTIDYTLASNSAIFNISAVAGFTATRIINVSVISKTADGASVVNNIKSYDLANNTFVIGTGGTSHVLPAGGYYIIIEYLK
ncbi:MAG: hypothetical protein ACK5NB_10770 [Flavobacteriaceae bacterium]